VIEAPLCRARLVLVVGDPPADAAEQIWTDALGRIREN
jgi:hypothetical protein